MDRYDECFADDESDDVTRNIRCSFQENRNQKQAASNNSPRSDREKNNFRFSVENEFVFDREWALKRRCSLSSLMYSRLQFRFGDRMKAF